MDRAFSRVPGWSAPGRPGFPVFLLALVVAFVPPPLHAESGQQVPGDSIEGSPDDYDEMPVRLKSWSEFRTRRVARGDAVTPLPVARDAPAIEYRDRGSPLTVDDYVDRHRLTGLLILRNGEIVVELYRHKRTPGSRFLSFSMAKSVISLLVGIAADQGLIESLDDEAEKYATELAGSPYGGTTIRHLLRMSSGLVFTERYDGHDDLARLGQAGLTGQPPVVDLLRAITERQFAEGERFAYASAETEVLGRVLTGATWRTVSDLTTAWLWEPIGAEQDAFWVIAHDGQEGASGGFNASLRDWGRLGMLLARDGRAGNRQVVSREYLLDATDALRQPEAFRPRHATSYFGYGYQFWLLPLRARTFSLQGLNGQAMYVQPSSGIVMVQTAVSDPDPAGREAFWLGVLQSLGGSTD